MWKRVLVVLAAIITIGWLLPFFKDLRPVPNIRPCQKQADLAAWPVDRKETYDNEQPEEAEQAEEEDDRVDLNRADFDQLLYLPGVGTDFAHRILNERRRVKGFQSVEDLLQIPGVGEKRLEIMRERIKV